jgi:hypothetical protein
MDLETKVNREILRAAVAKTIMCQVSGHVLDVKSAVLAEIKFLSGNVTNVVVTGHEWTEDLKNKLSALPGVVTLTVYDGRELYARKKG